MVTCVQRPKGASLFCVQFHLYFSIFLFTVWISVLIACFPSQSTLKLGSGSAPIPRYEHPVFSLITLLLIDFFFPRLFFRSEAGELLDSFLRRLEAAVLLDSMQTEDVV